MTKYNENLNDVIDRLNNLENKINSLLESNDFEKFVNVKIPINIIKKIDKIVAYNSGHTTRSHLINHVLDRYLKQQDLTKED